MRCLHTTAELAWYWCIIQKRQRSLELLRPTVKALDLAETNQFWRTCRTASGRCERKAGCRCARRATSAGLLRSALTKTRGGRSDVASMTMSGCCLVGRFRRSLGAMRENIGVWMKRNSNILELQKQRVCTQKGAHIIAYPIDGPWTYVVFLCVVSTAQARISVRLGGGSMPPPRI